MVSTTITIDKKTKELLELQKEELEKLLGTKLSWNMFFKILYLLMRDKKVEVIIKGKRKKKIILEWKG